MTTYKAIIIDAGVQGNRLHADVSWQVSHYS